MSDWAIGGDMISDALAEFEALRKDHAELQKEAEQLREEIKDYVACLQNLWDKELIPEDTDIWDEVKELLEGQRDV